MGAPQGSLHSMGEALCSSVPMALALSLLPAHSAIGVAGRHPYVWERSKSGSTVCSCPVFKKKKKLFGQGLAFSVNSWFDHQHKKRV